MTTPVDIRLARDGALLHILLNRPKANIVDGEMIAALDRAFADHAGDANLKAVVLGAQGPNFSFGASVKEHLPDDCAAMLAAMHGLVLRILDYPVPVLVAIQGQCLGGGLEIATAGHLLFAAPGARLGQPEIKLAVFAPAASCLLPERIGQARAEDLLLSGRSLSGQEAVAAGLVTALDESPIDAATEYFDNHLAPLSGAALRVAVRAARTGFSKRVHDKIAAVEKLYLEDLMATRDAVEGLGAFIEKRTPQWENR